ncbi:MAG TPA: DUF5703 domain-containing protein [Phycisphaerae bacterium]|nr:DUF5703 domain-containing protein [Phycisphaerae bacterium]
MQKLLPLLLLTPTLLAAAPAPSPSTAPLVLSSPPFIIDNDITWTSLGTNENDSMPLGNGDFAANVWTEQNGDLLLLLAKSDAWAETGNLLKLGRVRIHLDPNPFTTATDFSQTLHLENATLELRSGENFLRIWIDANHPVLHVDAHLAQPASIQAHAEFWRKTTTPANAPSLTPDPRYATGQASPPAAPDIIFPAADNRLAFCHFNPDSYYPYLLHQEHLDPSLHKYPDPLLHRAFGYALSGRNFHSTDDQTLASTAPAQNFSLQIVALSQTQSSPAAWQSAADALIGRATADSGNPGARDDQLLQHNLWWQFFWNRSYIHITGFPDAATVSQGYAVQRYMLACSSRGAFPAKYNGGLFTVGHDMPPGAKQSKESHDPDYRAWGDSFWNQNNRLLYYPLIATGDYDLLTPWFDMYLNALPLATDRAQIYYHHPGAFFPETMKFYGIPRIEDFGRDNITDEMQSHWQRYHIQGSLEVITQMLDVYDQTQDPAFAKKYLVPFADPILAFYYYHYPRDKEGKLELAPAQSLETYQLVAVNPTPDIAGLTTILPRLLALPDNLTTDAQRAAWSKMQSQLPPIPLGTTAKGKIPPFGQGDKEGLPTILPAEMYGRTGNGENPELYVVFPYRLYGLGKPDLQTALNAFAARRSPQNTCWGQDGTQASLLGLTDIAKKAAIAEFSNFGDQRFPFFWKPAHDWIPDLDNGGDGMITLQNMLLQTDGTAIRVAPSWPPDWTADFKLHAPFNTTIQAHVEAGKITHLVVTPPERAKDIIFPQPPTTLPSTQPATKPATQPSTQPTTQP